MIGAVLVAFIAIVVAFNWNASRRRHDAILERLQLRVHVNGIRGKSSVTRLIAAVLREAGYVTVAKTTGSAARVIGPSGEEREITRHGAATITEQVDIVRTYAGDGIEALVVECMAVNPLYQRHAQELIVRGDITIITNVREDHQEVMGETLEQIADSMSVTIPHNGTLVTGEDREHLRDRLAANAKMRGSSFYYADAAVVTEEDMASFDYVEHRSNVAVGLKIAEILGIDRAVAMRGMWKAVPDIGALRLSHFDVGGKDVLWVPLFAANDRESVVGILEMLAPHLAGRTTIGLLNNRWDRGRRAELFADMAATDLRPFLDRIVTFGAYEHVVSERLVDNGYPPDLITHLGESVNPTLERVLDTLAGLMPTESAALIGLVNIHTPQAEMLLEYFGADALGADLDELELSRRDERMPDAVRRYRRSAPRAKVATSRRARVPLRG